jgi:hypothetical protein
MKNRKISINPRRSHTTPLHSLPYDEHERKIIVHKPLHPPYFGRALRKVTKMIFQAFSSLLAMSLVYPVEAQMSSLYLRNGTAPSMESISLSNTVTTRYGRVFSLDNVSPYSSLFSSDIFVAGEGGKYVTNKLTNEVFDVAVYKRTDNDGTQVIVTKDSYQQVKYIQIREPTGGNGGSGKTSHFISDPSAPGSFFSLDNSDYDFTAITNMMSLDEDLTPRTVSAQEAPSVSPANAKGTDSTPVNTKTTSSQPAKATGSSRSPHGSSSSGNQQSSKSSGKGPNRRRNQAFSFTSGDGTSAECTSFKLVPVSIVFDSEFCQLYNGNVAEAVASIQTIVATASIFYENDLCTRLIITGISTDTCNNADSVYATHNKTKCSRYLSDFTSYMMQNRDNIGIDGNSIVHMFTGHSLEGTLGCAWYPGVCDREFGKC